MITGDALELFELNRVEGKGNAFWAATFGAGFRLRVDCAAYQCIQPCHRAALFLFNTWLNRSSFVAFLPFLKLPLYGVIESFLKEGLKVRGEIFAGRGAPGFFFAATLVISIFGLEPVVACLLLIGLAEKAVHALCKSLLAHNQKI